MNPTTHRNDTDVNPQVQPMPIGTQPILSLGQRLAAAREAHGWSIDYCAEALHLPRGVLRKLEADQHLGIDYAIYLRSYIAKYGRLLGLADAELVAELPQIEAVQPQLVSTGGISRSRYLLERYARAATYVLMTAVIVVPVVWLGISGALDHNISRLDPLDAAPVASTAASVGDPALPDTALAETKPTAPAPLKAPSLVNPIPGASSSAPGPERPLMASMLPGLDQQPASAVASPAVTPTTDAAVVGAGAHSLGLVLGQASWIEIVSADGHRLAYGLMAAGSNKTFRSDQGLVVRIGNVSGAQVSLDGTPLALDGFRHANVARFKIAVQGSSASANAF